MSYNFDYLILVDVIEIRSCKQYLILYNLHMTLNILLNHKIMTANIHPCKNIIHKLYFFKVILTIKLKNIFLIKNSFASFEVLKSIKINEKI